MCSQPSSSLQAGMSDGYLKVLNFYSCLAVYWPALEKFKWLSVTEVGLVPLTKLLAHQPSKLRCSDSPGRLVSLNGVRPLDKLAARKSVFSTACEAGLFVTVSYSGRCGRGLVHRAMCCIAPPDVDSTDIPAIPYQQSHSDAGPYHCMPVAAGIAMSRPA